MLGIMLGLMLDVGNKKVNKTEVVKNWEFSEILPYLGTSESSCHSFMDNGYETPGLGQSLYAYGTPIRRSFTLGWISLVLQVPLGWHEGAQIDAA